MTIDKLKSGFSEAQKLPEKVKEFVKEHPVITGIAMAALGCLLIANSFGVIHAESLRDLGVGANIGITFGVMVFGAILFILAKRGEDSNNPKVQKICKTIITAMKVFFPVLVIGFLVVSNGWGSKFFTTDMQTYEMVPFAAGFFLAGYGAYSLFTGVVRAGIEHKMDNAKSKDEIVSLTKFGSRYHNFAGAVACLAVTVAFSVVAHYAIDLSHHGGGHCAYAATIISLAGAITPAIFLLSKGINAAYGVQDNDESKYLSNYGARRLNKPHPDGAVKLDDVAQKITDGWELKEVTSENGHKYWVVIDPENDKNRFVSENGQLIAEEDYLLRLRMEAL